MTTLDMVAGAGGVAKTPEAARRAKLVDASQQFEAMMMSQMLKPLEFGAAPDAAGEQSTGGAADTVRGIATEALGKALAQHGGVGIARSVLKQVLAEESARPHGGQDAGHELVAQKRTGAKVQ